MGIFEIKLEAFGNVFDFAHCAQTMQCNSFTLFKHVYTLFKREAIFQQNPIFKIILKIDLYQNFFQE